MSEIPGFGVVGLVILKSEDVAVLRFLFDSFFLLFYIPPPPFLVKTTYPP